MNHAMIKAFVEGFNESFRLAAAILRCLFKPLTGLVRSTVPVRLKVAQAHASKQLRHRQRQPR